MPPNNKRGMRIVFKDKLMEGPVGIPTPKELTIAKVSRRR